MATNRIKAVALLLCGLLLTANPRDSVGQPGERKDLGTLRVLSVRKMSNEEYKNRVTDQIGAEYSVRFRFEAPADHAVLVYAMNCGEPAGYALTRRGKEVRWSFAIRPGEDPSKSPGFKRFGAELLTERDACWIRMYPLSAYEWETEEEPTASGAEIAQSIFVKRRTDPEPTELISPWYTVPATQQ
jgi:hypothetical protein